MGCRMCCIRSSIHGKTGVTLSLGAFIVPPSSHLANFIATTLIHEVVSPLVLPIRLNQMTQWLVPREWLPRFELRGIEVAFARSQLADLRLGTS